MGHCGGPIKESWNGHMNVAIPELWNGLRGESFYDFVSHTGPQSKEKNGRPSNEAPELKILELHWIIRSVK